MTNTQLAIELIKMLGVNEFQNAILKECIMTLLEVGDDRTTINVEKSAEEKRIVMEEAADNLYDAIRETVADRTNTVPAIVKAATVQEKSETDPDTEQSQSAALSKDPSFEKLSSDPAATKKAAPEKKRIDWKKAEACRRAGWSIKAIAEEIGCTDAAVYAHFRKTGVTNK